MRISVRGQNNVLSKSEIRDAVSFFGNILLGKRLASNIEVILYNEVFTPNEMGFCNPTEDERSPREFEILLNNKMPRNDQLVTIAHEMVHVKQFALNEFKVYDNDEYRWRGKKVRHPRKRHRDLPWEKEAISSEKWLMHFYERYQNDSNL